MPQDKVDFDLYNSVMHMSDDLRSRLSQLFDGAVGDSSWKLQNFPVFAPRQSLTRFLARYHLFERVLGIQGSIVECGVFGGGGLMSWLHFSSILEPLNYQRRIIGFDTFEGFADMATQDKPETAPLARKGALALDSFNLLAESAAIHSANMLVQWPEKVDLVKGDATETIPSYLEDHPETLVSLLYLDFDVYTPTKTALEHLLPRMPAGAVIAFDELNNPEWPGETTAVLESMDLRSLRIERFAFETKLSFAVL